MYRNMFIFTDCPYRLSPGVLDGPLFCRISSSCTYVKCCIHDEITQRNFEIHFHIDPCNFSIVFGIEQYIFEESLLEFDFGKFKTYRYIYCCFPVGMILTVLCF